MKPDKEKIDGLVERIKQGDKKAFDELYRLTSPGAYFIALKIVQNEHDAEDILQECYIKFVEKIDNIDPAQSFTGWFYRVVANQSKDLLKRKKHLVFEGDEEAIFEDIPDENTQFNPEENLNQDEMCREIMAAVDELSAVKRTCVVMKYFGEMSVSEIADSLEISESAVKSRLYNARKDLKDKFEKNGLSAVYGAAPIAVAVWALARSSESVAAAFAASAASTAVLTGIGTSAAVSTTAATTTAASTAAATAAKAVSLSAAQKVIAGVAAVSVIGGGTAGIVTVVRNNNTPDETTSYIEEVTTAPSQTAEYAFGTVTQAEESTATEGESTAYTTAAGTTEKRHTVTQKETTAKPLTTARNTTTKKEETTTHTQTTTQKQTTTQAETTIQPTTVTTQPAPTEATTQASAMLIIEVTDYDDNVVDTLTLMVDAGTEMTWDYLITLISQNGYEAMAGVYGDGVGAVAQAGETYTFTAEL